MKLFIYFQLKINQGHIFVRKSISPPLGDISHMWMDLTLESQQRACSCSNLRGHSALVITLTRHPWCHGGHNGILNTYWSTRHARFLFLPFCNQGHQGQDHIWKATPPQKIDLPCANVSSLFRKDKRNDVCKTATQIQVRILKKLHLFSSACHLNSYKEYNPDDSL